ncbi:MULTISPECIES: DUF1643 domain-containing protein [Bacillaceae]|uniref:DUF1643 domain-containing protein n=1 Tax=Gottfriedia luciferensis TaxID=178774 RepID=A0ABX2ZPB0_9BACI|nr:MULTISPECIES: DUF1643 domain-containing protein [Bacillaceae]ODG91438.1 hypothetical protein BED47_07210 [Gottfriedia luciferensis]PGZ92102.1 DUF1643 domain-containing protein [Bacillus sp. AFS029533]SFC93212.1 hypothetical protein SAMN02799633_02028 [Bacillus sp. UNCCL81]
MSFEDFVNCHSMQIHTKAVFDKQNKLMRYSLTRTWDESKKKATLVLLNPCRANHLKSDYILARCLNFFIDYKKGNFGSLELVNLFALMEPDSTKLKGKECEVGEHNDEAIKLAISNADIIIVGWGSSKRFKWRIKEVLDLLEPYKDKLFNFCDDSNRKDILIHPVILAERHWLEKLNFEALYEWTTKD